MEKLLPPARDDRHPVASYHISAGRRQAGRGLIVLASLGFAAIFLLQFLRATGVSDVGFDNWRPVLYAYVIWSIEIGRAHV